MGHTSSVTYLIAGAMLTLMIGAAFYFLMGDLYISWLIGANITTFFLFATDKFKAKRRGSRVPEWILLFFPFIGGFLGGWLGMLLIHHKTKHIPFYIVMSISTGIHISLLFNIYL